MKSTVACQVFKGKWKKQANRGLTKNKYQNSQMRDFELKAGYFSFEKLYDICHILTNKCHLYKVTFDNMKSVPCLVK